MPLVPLPVSVFAAAWFAMTAVGQDGVARATGQAMTAPPLCAARQVFAAQSRFDRPLFVAFPDPAGDRAYVVEQAGRIWAVPRDDEAEEREPFADMTDRVYSGAHWEEGLLGFAFDPGYADHGQVFVCYSEKTPPQQAELRPGRRVKSTRRSVIARFSTKVVDGRRVVDATSELRVLVVAQPFGNHNGGTIVFGRDGMLYAAFGDGGAQRDPLGAGQDLGMLLGKVLRLDVRQATVDQPYAIPTDNPFVATAAARGEIWCFGLRNPWRIAFDRATGELWCGDVGQDRREEVDRLVKGGNYGWSLMEGSEVFRPDAERPADLIAPIADYGRDEGVSVTGGHVYRGAGIPALVGSYVYGDFATMRLWAAMPSPDGGFTVHAIGRAPAQLSSFAEEPDGELLMTCFDGRVYRLVPAPDGG